MMNLIQAMGPTFVSCEHLSEQNFPHTNVHEKQIERAVDTFQAKFCLEVMAITPALIHTLCFESLLLRY